MRMSLHDGPVHSRGVAKVIRIDDQAPHAVSLAAERLQKRHALEPLTGREPCDLPRESVRMWFDHFSDAPVYSFRRGSRGFPSNEIWLVRPSGRAFGHEGRLAQLVRAPALQAGGRRFESCTAHQRHFVLDPRFSSLSIVKIFPADSESS